ncbi:MAG TPA: hypothetical protein PKN30_08755, partial [Flavobacteriales bacterium]|nr:hypothetical protein [Flavobacteriales bacterium]
FGLLPKRPTGHPPFAFRDLEGREYFGWADLQDMPAERVNQIEDVILQVDASISKHNLEAIAEAMVLQCSAALEAKDAKARTMAINKVMTLANELLIRPTNIIPEDCYIALAAICAVRKDEDPYAFDKTIQAEKMAQFKAAGRAGHAFFTQTGAFQNYVGAMRTTEDALKSLLVSWIYQEERTRQALRICGYQSSGKNDMQSSKP